MTFPPAIKLSVECIRFLLFFPFTMFVTNAVAPCGLRAIVNRRNKHSRNESQMSSRVFYTKDKSEIILKSRIFQVKIKTVLHDSVKISKFVLSK